MVLAYLGHLSSLGPFMSPLERKAKTSSLNWLLLRLSISSLLPILAAHPLLQHVQNDDLQTAFASPKPQHALSDIVYAGIRKIRTDGSLDMKALLEANSVKWSGSWFHALPLPYAGLTMSVLEYRTALRFRTGHEVLSSTGRCCFYTTGYSDAFGFHELSCPGQVRLISRHNALRDCLYSLGQQAGLSVQGEPQYLLQDGPGDIPADFYLVRSTMVVICVLM
jgi:hypothetical protein